MIDPRLHRAAALALLLAARPAAAATFVVDTTADEPDAALDGACATAANACSLRAALQEVNGSAGGTITFAFTEYTNLTLASALPAVVRPLTIEGPAASTVTLSRSLGGPAADGRVLHLDPGAGNAVVLSRLRVGGYEIAGTYFPGHLLGDRVTVCVHPSAVSVSARNGAPRANQMAFDLEYVAEGAQRARLHFSGGFRAEIHRDEWRYLQKADDFAVEIAPAALRLVKP